MSKIWDLFFGCIMVTNFCHVFAVIFKVQISLDWCEICVFVSKKLLRIMVSLRVVKNPVIFLVQSVQTKSCESHGADFMQPFLLTNKVICCIMVRTRLQNLRFWVVRPFLIFGQKFLSNFQNRTGPLGLFFSLDTGRP